MFLALLKILKAFTKLFKNYSIINIVNFLPTLKKINFA